MSWHSVAPQPTCGIHRAKHREMKAWMTPPVKEGWEGKTGEKQVKLGNRWENVSSLQVNHGYPFASALICLLICLGTSPQSLNEMTFSVLLCCPRLENGTKTEETPKAAACPPDSFHSSPSLCLWDCITEGTACHSQMRGLVCPSLSASCVPLQRPGMFPLHVDPPSSPRSIKMTTEW